MRGWPWAVVRSDSSLIFSNGERGNVVQVWGVLVLDERLERGGLGSDERLLRGVLGSEGGCLRRERRLGRRFEDDGVESCSADIDCGRERNKDLLRFMAVGWQLG